MSDTLFLRARPWLPFALYMLVLFGFFLGVTWPKWWAAVGLTAVMVVGSLGHRELRRRHRKEDDGGKGSGDIQE